MARASIRVRQGDSLSPLLFIILPNEFDVLMRSRCEGVTVNLNFTHEPSVANDLGLLKIYTFFSALDTLLLNESESDMQRDLDATYRNCLRRNMTINAFKTKFMICSRGKTRNTSTFVVNGNETEHVDTFCYLGTKFKNNNPFKSPKNVIKAKKHLFKLAVLSSKIDFELETKLNLFETFIQPIFCLVAKTGATKTLNKLKCSIVKYYEEPSE